MNSNINILLVEDNMDHVELTLGALEEANVVNKIMVMKNGTEALKYIKMEGKYADSENYPRPGLILLDIKLPDMTGKDILRVIKTDMRLKKVPVVMLTSSARMEDINESYELGANSYIDKPVSFGDFFETVKKIPLYWALTNRLPS